MIFKELETDRLFLKNISEEDSEFILSQFSDDDVNKYLYDAEPMIDYKEAVDLIKFYTYPEPRYQHRWVLVRKCDGLKIGTCGFHCWDTKQNKIDVGYDLKKAFWGNGYMQEAMNAIISFAIMKLDIHRIDAHIYYENLKSITLAQKLGFKFYGVTEVCLFRGQEYLHHIYTMTI